MFTCEISSQDETRPGMKSSLSIVKRLVLFTRSCRGEIPSPDERQVWNFARGWKRLKKTCKHFIPGWNFKMSMFFINFWRIYLNILSKVNVIEHNESMNVMKHKASLEKVKSEKKKNEDNKWKIKNLKTSLLFFYFLCGV